MAVPVLSKLSGEAGDDLMPWLHTVNPLNGSVTLSGVWIGLTISGAPVYYNSSLTVGDEIAWDLVLAAGTWELMLQTWISTDRGKVQPRLDAVDQGSPIDLYGTNAAYTIKTLSGIVIPTTGKKRLSLKCATKNASSSGNVVAIHPAGVSMRRTA